ncbi:MAG TPA: gluconate 2-dehydrogenase subunit 3 family protein [Vicinamibacterales bacterium]|jgi:gluconate 2-dehydrogenase gamma chain|nr:gluconate 2-dehydrogenase subunit 3 family protein [Vicinamibacterales bacterium]
MTFISRRDLLKRVGAAAAVVPAARAFEARDHASSVARDPRVSGLRSAESVAQESAAPLESFTAAEAELMDAIVARLIPTDEHGPGATEAHAVRYIDRALGGALAASRQAYAAGLAALDRYAHSSRGAAFARLSATDQDSVLIDVETGAATGFTGGSAAFFGMVLGHTHQGMFGDPYYGGNANFVGWDLLAYPGVRTMVTSADQKALETRQLKPNHRSAYDYVSFTKASHDHEA